MAVSEEKIQQRSRRRGQFSSSRSPCRKVPKPCQPENRGRIFQQVRNLPENLSSKELRTATAFSSFLIFSGRKLKIQNCIAEADARMQVYFLSQANWNYMVDGDVVSSCLHALVLSICRRSNCGDGGIRITLQMQRQISFPKNENSNHFR